MENQLVAHSMGRIDTMCYAVQFASLDFTINGNSLNNPNDRCVFTTFLPFQMNFSVKSNVEKHRLENPIQNTDAFSHQNDSILLYTIEK